MIIARGLTKTFYDHIPKTALSSDSGSESLAVTAVQNISLHIKKGETVGLFGANGAGKTTLLKLICGTLMPTDGKLWVFGKNPVGRKMDKDSCIGFLSGQQIADASLKRAGAGGLLPEENASLERNLEILGNIYRIPGKLQKERIHELSEDRNLTDIFSYRPAQLSLGQRMRAELAAIFFFEPALFILDEPFLGLDAIAKESIRKQLKRYADRPESTVILTTHNLAEAERICERILIMDKGALVYDGNLEQLKKSRLGHHVLQAVFRRGFRIWKICRWKNTLWITGG